VAVSWAYVVVILGIENEARTQRIVHGKRYAIFSFDLSNHPEEFGGVRAGNDRAFCRIGGQRRGQSIDVDTWPPSRLEPPAQVASGLSTGRVALGSAVQKA